MIVILQNGMTARRELTWLKAASFDTCLVLRVMLLQCFLLCNGFTNVLLQSERGVNPWQMWDRFYVISPTHWGLSWGRLPRLSASKWFWVSMLGHPRYVAIYLGQLFGTGYSPPDSDCIVCPWVWRFAFCPFLSCSSLDITSVRVADPRRILAESELWITPVLC